MLGPFATTSRLTPIHQVSPLYCRTPPAHWCTRRQRQRVTEGTVWPHGMGTTNKQYGDRQMRERQRQRWRWNEIRPKCEQIGQKHRVTSFMQRMTLPLRQATDRHLLRVQRLHVYIHAGTVGWIREKIDVVIACYINVVIFWGTVYRPIGYCSFKRTWNRLDPSLRAELRSAELIR